jgi:5-methylcytosine-specific restriction protein A
MPTAAITLSQIKNQTATRRPDHRPSAAKRGYGARWRKARMYFLTIHPLCVDCKKMDMIRQATVVDHIIPHKGNQALFWDMANNWQSLCKKHHDIKTATEDGGFGHKIKENN